MAEVEPNDDDVFEIDDFTVVSPLETLVSALEVAIHELALEGARPLYDIKRLDSSWKMEVKESPVSYDSNSFILQWHRPVLPTKEEKKEKNEDDDEDFEFRREEEERVSTAHYSAAARQISCSSLDFCTQNNISAMYGVAEFLSLVGRHSTNDRIATHGQMDFVMSALRVALNNTNCELPLFVLCGAPERELYFGSAESKTQSISFLPAHLHQISQRHTNLTGLIGLMKEKVRTKASVVDVEEVEASIRFEYAFKEPERSRRRFTGDEKKLIRDCKDCRDSLKLALVTHWPRLPETRVHENESFTNLEPTDSNHWEIYADFEPHYQPYSNRLKVALQHVLSDNSPLAKDLFTPPPADPEEEQPKKNDEREHVLPTEMGQADWRNMLGGDVLSAIDEDDRRFASWTKTDYTPSHKDPLYAKALEELKLSKSAGPRSIAARLAVQIAHVIDDESDIAVKWISFARLLRHHWENNKELPGMTGVESPNLGSCLLNQKLEMLQCCIRARLQRHAYYDTHGHEEFFDAEEDLTGRTERSGREAGDRERQPTGRKQRLAQLSLHFHPDTPLFIPETQMACPMTEDMVQAHAEHLSSLKEGRERTEAQLGLLRSDMQAFKAANPQCHLVDFIRWHSPKDWDDESGELSERMRLEDNAWERCWREAAPLAAVHQQPHFNEATVAEGILSLFDHATIAQVTDWILPLLFHFAALQLISEEENVREEGDSVGLSSIVVKATRDTAQPAKSTYYQALQKMRKYERLAHFYSHMWRTFWRQQFLRRENEENEIRRLIREIMKESDILRDENAMFRNGIRIPGAAGHCLGEIIAGDFQGQNGLLNKNQIPTRKSYVVFWRVPVPSASSRIQPQRMYANIEYENNRLCCATSLDAVFI